MAVMPKTVSIGAGVSNDNVFSGSAFEFARGPQMLSMGIAAAAAGLFCTIQSGSDIVAEEFELPVLTRYPIIPDEMYFNDIMALGDRLVARVRNPTGGAVIVRAMAQVNPIGG